MDTKRIIRKIGIILILGMSLVSFLIGISTAKASSLDSTSDPKLDIRFVVDVSANMKKHDPDGSRIMALQKMVKAIPYNSKAGIWTYGKQVNMLVPFGTVDAKWKKAAIYKVATISAFGDYRNLEDAINKATYGWQNKSSYKKHMIVVTNGDLKVSPSKVKNAKSQLQLLTSTLARLKSANIELHTISFGDDADNRLLKVLAYETHGKWYSVADAKLLSGILNHAYKNILAKAKTSSMNLVASAKSKTTKSMVKQAKAKMNAKSQARTLPKSRIIDTDEGENLAEASETIAKVPSKADYFDDEDLISSDETSKNLASRTQNSKKAYDANILAAQKAAELKNKKSDLDYSDVAYMDELDKIDSAGATDSISSNPADEGSAGDSIDFMNDVDSMGYMNSGDRVNPINEQPKTQPTAEQKKPDASLNQTNTMPVNADNANQWNSAPTKPDASAQQLPKATPNQNNSMPTVQKPALKNDSMNSGVNKDPKNMYAPKNKSKIDDEMDFNWPTVYSD